MTPWGLTAALLLAPIGPACAQTAEGADDAFTLSANAALVSDYRFRGISLSNRDPAIQGGIDLNHESGFSIGTWASSLASNGGANMELDLYGGYAGSAGGIDYSVTALGYFYPGTSGLTYFELAGSVGTTLGPATVGLDAAWVPDQANFGGENFSLSGRAEVAVSGTPVKLFGHVGYEDGDVYRRKWDWEAGLSYTRGPLTASLSYVDSNYSGPNEAGRLAGAGVVASLSASF